MDRHHARDVGRAPGPPPAANETTRADVAERSERERWVVCNACGGLVADGRAKTVVGGAFAHSFINPAGMIFRVGCFAEAPGARATGEASEHWSWFAGFKWQAGLCVACGRHLGWFFTGGERGFVALILDAVSERGAPGSGEA